MNFENRHSDCSHAIAQSAAVKAFAN